MKHIILRGDYLVFADTVVRLGKNSALRNAFCGELNYFAFRFPVTLEASLV